MAPSLMATWVPQNLRRASVRCPPLRERMFQNPHVTYANESVLLCASASRPKRCRPSVSGLGNGNQSRAALSGQLAVFPVEREVESGSLWKLLLLAPKGS